MTKITLSGTMPPAPPPPMTNSPPTAWHAEDPMPARWMFNGQFCTVEQFAKCMWPDDEQAQLVFLLKYPR
jgi:hypothetical protein